MNELTELQGWSGIKQSIALLHGTTKIYDFGTALRAGIYMFFESSPDYRTGLRLAVKNFPHITS